MTKDDLEQIGKEIETKLEAEREHTRGLFEAERSHTKQTFETAIEASEKQVMQKIDQQGEQIMDAIADTATEIFKEQDKRISRIENHLGLPHKNYMLPDKECGDVIQ